MKNKNFIAGFMGVLLFILAGFTIRSFQGNHPPVVKISSPRGNLAYPLHTLIPYSVQVSDAEDGESKYDEINGREVYLEVRYLADTSGFWKKTGLFKETDAPGFSLIRSSNCVNCHLFKTHLIGPSYREISGRYPDTEENIRKLVDHIREGSTGVWGNVKMPSHPELKEEQIGNIVAWILKAGSDPSLNYYTGTEGALQLDPPEGVRENGFFMLTASYLDHGTKEDSLHRLTGYDRIIIRGK